MKYLTLPADLYAAIYTTMCSYMMSLSLTGSAETGSTERALHDT